jgi:rsbT co-antagonist protein RsbR
MGDGVTLKDNLLMTIYTLLTILIVVAEVGLGVFVATRAWAHRPARWFLAYIIGVATFSLGVITSTIASDTVSIWVAQLLAVFGLCWLQIALICLLSALFVPQWWEGKRPIRWIILPYIVFTGLLVLDLVFQAGLLVAGLSTIADGTSQIAAAEPLGSLMTLLFFLGWLIPQAILIVAFIRQPAQRGFIAAFFLAIGLAVVLGWLFGIVLQIPELSALVAVPIVLTLATAIFRTRLFTSDDAAITLALRSMREAVAVFDQDQQCVYANMPALALGLRTSVTLSNGLQTAGANHEAIQQLLLPRTNRDSHVPLTIGKQRFECSLNPVRDARGQMRGMLLLGRDISELAAQQLELEKERSRLAYVVEQLTDEKAERAALAERIRSIALPVIPVLEGILVMPLIGELDQERIHSLTGILLDAIDREKARVALIDITGVPILDTHGAAALVQATEAAKLLGARCMLVGIRPEIAQTLVTLGVPIGSMATAATLQQGLRSVM